MLKFEKKIRRQKVNEARKLRPIYIVSVFTSLVERVELVLQDDGRYLLHLRPVSPNIRTINSPYLNSAGVGVSYERSPTVLAGQRSCLFFTGMGKIKWRVHMPALETHPATCSVGTGRYFSGATEQATNHPLSRLRMSGRVPPLPYVPSWRLRENVCLNLPITAFIIGERRMSLCDAVCPSR